MTSRVSLSWGPGDSSQTRRLAECDKNISRIATDVTELSAELTRLQSEGQEMARLLLEQDALLREQRQAIASLENERGRLQGHAHELAAARGDVEAALASQVERTATVERERDALRSGIEERERNLDAVRGELGRLSEVLAERERALEQEHAIAERAKDAMVREEQRSAGLAVELTAAAAAEARLQAALASHQELVTSLEREREMARSRIDARERELVDVQNELARAAEALAGRERALEQERTTTARVREAMSREEQRSADLASELEASTAARARLEADLVEARSRSNEPVVPRARAAEAPPAGHLRMFALPEGGYELTASNEPCPRPGERTEVGGRTYVVARTGRSPLPGDDRSCALLVPDW